MVTHARGLSFTDQTEVDCSPSTENSEQHNLLEQLQSRYRQMEERITCPICIDNHIKLVFQCGHASCIECSAALKTCPICRQTIRERIQLFVWKRRGPWARFKQKRRAPLANSPGAHLLLLSWAKWGIWRTAAQPPLRSSIPALLLLVDVCYPSRSLAHTVYKVVQRWSLYNTSLSLY